MSQFWLWNLKLSVYFLIVCPSSGLHWKSFSGHFDFEQFHPYQVLIWILFAWSMVIHKKMDLSSLRFPSFSNINFSWGQFMNFCCSICPGVCFWCFADSWGGFCVCCWYGNIFEFSFDVKILVMSVKIFVPHIKILVKVGQKYLSFNPLIENEWCWCPCKNIWWM